MIFFWQVDEQKHFWQQKLLTTNTFDQVLLLVLHIAWVGAALLLQQVFPPQVFVADFFLVFSSLLIFSLLNSLLLILISVQAEKRRQSGLPWIFVTALMIVAQIVGASLAATDFGEEYNVNFIVIVI